MTENEVKDVENPFKEITKRKGRRKAKPKGPVTMKVCQGSHGRMPDTPENFPPNKFEGRYCKAYLIEKGLL